MTVRDKTIPERQLRDVQELTDNTAGTSDGALEDITDTSATDQSGPIENNFVELNEKLNEILNLLKY